MQSIYIDAQCSDLSAHSLYIQRRYIEAIEQIIKSLRKYSLIEKNISYLRILKCASSISPLHSRMNVKTIGLVLKKIYI